MSQQQLTFTALPDIPLIRSGDDLVAITLAGLSAAGVTLSDGDVIVVGQKIISKAEGRFVDLKQIHPSPEASSSSINLGSCVLMRGSTAPMSRTRRAANGYFSFRKTPRCRPENCAKDFRRQAKRRSVS